MKSFKKIVFSMSLLFSVQLVVAQNQSSKIGLELHYYLQEASPSEMIPLLVEGNGEGLEEWVNSLGGSVRMKISNLYSLEIPSNQVETFSQSELVKDIEFSRAPARTLNDTMLIQTRADRIHRREAPLRLDYTGKGVLLGVIDSGIELDHPDFQDSLGNTRILYVWDQKVTYDPNRKPGKYSYGVEWDSTSINNNSSTHDDDPAEFGHGSMVTGAAASNANGSGHFKGVAPDADIIAVATDFSANNWLQTVAEAVDYIYAKADSMGMPCVINASIGTYLGSHDGEDIAARMIDLLIKSKSGRMLVAAAGNAGQHNFHLQHNPNGDTSFTWLESEIQLFSGQGGIYYQMWSDSADMQNLQFAFGADLVSSSYYEFRGRTAFDSIQNRLNTIHLDSIMSHDNNLLAYVYTYAEYSNGRYLLEVAIPQPDSAQYNYRLETTGNGKLDLWSSLGITGTSDIVVSSVPSPSLYPAISKYVFPDSMQTIVSSFTCLESVVTVGNYMNRNSYVDVNGVTQYMGIVPGQISPNSSLGPNRRNYLKPDISSAGDYMMAAGRLATIAQVIQSTPSKISFDSLHMRNGGTSMAAPTVSGMIALYLEQCPGSDYLKIKNDLLNTHRRDQYSSMAPDEKWGIGKADAFAFLNQNVYQPQLASLLVDYCDGDSALISVSSPYPSYKWNTGDSTASILVTQAGIYYAKVDDGTCLSVSDSIQITFKPSPQKLSIQVQADSLIIQQAGFFEWYFNGNRILGQSDSILVATQSGDYHAIIIAANGCSANSDTIQYVSTFIDEFEQRDVLIYPNPTKENIQLSFNNPIEEIQLVDINGKILFQAQEIDQRQQMTIDMSQYKSGVYFLQLNTDNGVSTEKVIKW